MTTRSDQDINASTAIHVGKTTVGYVKGQSEMSLLEQEREAQLTDLQYREGRSIPGVEYPINPALDESGALKFETTGVPVRDTSENQANRGLGGPTEKGMGGSKPADTNVKVGITRGSTKAGIIGFPGRKK